MIEVAEKLWTIIIDRRGEARALECLEWLEAVYIAENTLFQLSLPPIERFARALQSLQELGVVINEASFANMANAPDSGMPFKRKR